LMSSPIQLHCAVCNALWSKKLYLVA
jgi:hypothetical protein